VDLETGAVTHEYRPSTHRRDQQAGGY